MGVGIGIGLPLEIGSKLVEETPVPWEPSQELQGANPLLWLRADQGVYTGGARQFTAANSESFSKASFTECNFSTTDFSIILSFNRSTAGNQVLLAKRQDANNYWKLEFTAANLLHFIAVSGGVTILEMLGLTAITTSGWHQVIINFDRDATITTKMYLDNVQDTNTLTTSAISVDNTGVFYIGENGDSSLYFNGLIARVGILKNDLLSTTERTWLYNLGNNRVYGELGVTGTDGAGLTNFSWWANGNEPSGNLIDAVGINDLTDNNTVTSADGPATDIASDSIGSNHGALTNFTSGPAKWSSDKPSGLSLVSGSLVFDGTNDYVSLTTITTGTTWSWSGWVKPNAQVSHYGGLFTGSVLANALFYTGSDGVGDARKLNLWYTTNHYSTGTLTDAAWNHVVVSVNSGTATFYINGSASGTASSAPSFSVNGMGYSTNVLKGSMADARYYAATALSASQVAELFAGSEATGATPTARWKLDDGPQTGVVTGDPVMEWRSIEGNNYQFQQATASKRPLYNSSAINSQPGIDFDGVDDLLVKSSAFLTGTEGTVVIVYRLDAVPNSYQTMLASSDEASNVRYLILYGRGNTANPHILYDQRNNDTDDALDGDTTVNVDTNYAVLFASNGTTVTGRLNGVAQTFNADSGANNGDWWDDTTAKDNISIGALKSLSGDQNFLSGKIAEIIVYPINLSEDSNAILDEYIFGRYGSHV